MRITWALILIFLTCQLGCNTSDPNASLASNPLQPIRILYYSWAGYSLNTESALTTVNILELDFTNRRKRHSSAVRKHPDVMLPCSEHENLRNVNSGKWEILSAIERDSLLSFANKWLKTNPPAEYKDIVPPSSSQGQMQTSVTVFYIGSSRRITFNPKATVSPPDEWQEFIDMWF